MLVENPPGGWSGWAATPRSRRQTPGDLSAISARQMDHASEPRQDQINRALVQSITAISKRPVREGIRGDKWATDRDDINAPPQTPDARFHHAQPSGRRQWREFR